MQHFRKQNNITVQNFRTRNNISETQRRFRKHNNNSENTTTFQKTLLDSDWAEHDMTFPSTVFSEMTMCFLYCFLCFVFCEMLLCFDLNDQHGNMIIVGEKDRMQERIR